MQDILIGAISGNYSIDKIRNWVESSNYDRENFKRVLIIFNPQDNTELQGYCELNNIEVLYPTYDFWGQPKEWFEHHTGKANLLSTYELIHNIRFFYINQFLSNHSQDGDKVIITDVSDVRFNPDKFPFDFIPSDKLVATSEVIRYKEDQWNYEHLIHNLGMLGLTIENEEVLNVGVFGGPASLVKDLSRDIYLLSVGKPKVADQTSFNYLIRTHYKDKTKVLGLEDKFAVHLQVIVNGLVDFNYNSIPEFSIVHQYDRIK